VGKGTARVRPPRLELEGAEYDVAIELIRERLAARRSATPAEQGVTASTR
jgi:hypothetical protein